jgi:hypothetical protein
MTLCSAFGYSHMPLLKLNDKSEPEFIDFFRQYVKVLDFDEYVEGRETYNKMQDLMAAMTTNVKKKERGRPV